MGVMIAQQGSSPQQMQAYQDAGRERPCRPIPMCRLTITATGLIGSASTATWVSASRFWIHPNDRVTTPADPMDRPKHAADSNRRRQICRSAIFDAAPPVCSPSCSRSRCCRSAPVPPAATPGSICLQPSPASIRSEVYATAGKLMGTLYREAGQLFPAAAGRRLQRHVPADAQSADRIAARSGRAPTASPPPASKRFCETPYSQNYVYLIKRPTNQYQVILEVDDQFARDPTI